MSADKHKKRDRAFAWLKRQRHNWRTGRSDGNPVESHFSHGPSAEMKWLVERGFAAIKRVSGFGRTGRARHNVFVERE